MNEFLALVTLAYLIIYGLNKTFNKIKSLCLEYLAYHRVIVLHIFFIFYVGLGLSNDEAPQFGDPEELRNKFAKIFASKTQAEWCAIFDNTDACVAPVVPLQEAHNYPHNKIRKSFVPSDKEESRLLPRPAPRLSAVEPGRKEELRPQPKVGEHTESVLHELGYSKKEIQDFITSGIVEQASSSKL